MESGDVSGRRDRLGEYRGLARLRMVGPYAVESLLSSSLES